MNKKNGTNKTMKNRNTIKGRQRPIMKKNKTVKRSRNRLGGVAVASGGFGCIFKPALKCKNEKTKSSGVSKMSIEQHGKQEMLEIERIRDKLKKVTNYSKYYLLDVELCKPDKLSVEDMKQFDKKCFSLTRYNINEKNVNNRLDRLTILNMPDAGVDLKEWLVEDGKITKKKMILLNKLIVKLLKNGVRPMNKRGVIHNDLKDRNVMVDADLNVRIIDWGLAGVVRSDVKLIQNIIPYEEIFTGSNMKSYKHKYFVGHIDSSIEPSNSFQETEVSEVSWLKYEECLQHIRPYNLEKINILTKLNTTLQQYRLY